MPELYHPNLREYLDGLVPNRPPEMEAMELYAKEHGFPIVGPASGQLCYLMARLIGARRVFELGSGYGYSTAWFCKAVRENGGGEVHHVVWDQELSDMARGHLKAIGYEDLGRYTVGEAVGALGKAEGPFDVIFNDIDKEGYPAALPVIEEKLRPGGVMIVDNLLWSGKVLEASEREASTEAIRTFTRMVTQDAAWTATIVPIRDGVLIARKG